MPTLCQLMSEEGVALYFEYQEKNIYTCIGLDAHDGAKIFYRVTKTYGLLMSPLAPNPAWHILLSIMFSTCG